MDEVVVRLCSGGVGGRRGSVEERGRGRRLCGEGVGWLGRDLDRRVECAGIPGGRLNVRWAVWDVDGR